MSIKVNLPDGRVVNFPDGMDPAQIQAEVQRLSPAESPESTTPPAAATAGMMAPSTEAGDPAPPDTDEMSDTAKNIRNTLQWGGNVIAGMTGMGSAGREAVKHPTATLVSGLVPIVAKQAPRAMEGVRRLTGLSRIRAGQNLDAVADAAQNVPVKTGTLTPTITRAKALQATGSRMPRVVTQLSRRIEQAQGGNLNWREAQDFASSLSRMSVNEYNTLNPQMQRQVTQIVHAVRQAQTEAAGTVGKGEQFTRGIGEYAKAARAAERWKETYRPGLIKALKYGGAGWLGYGGLKKISGE